jgi:hypothetical protein
VKTFLTFVPIVSASCALAAQLQISSFNRAGDFTLSNAFTNGVCVLRRADAVEGPWRAVSNLFTFTTVTQASVNPTGAASFYFAEALDLSMGRAGFTNLTRAYGVLTTIAGAGGVEDINNWRPEFEGAPATEVLLSAPHITVADRAGCLYIADKDAHGIRKIRLDGTLITVAGINAPGDASDAGVQGPEGALNGPNGLWVKGDGTVFILDLNNGKIRRLDTNGLMTTFITVPGGISVGRGLWVNDAETVAYVCSGTVVKKWVSGVGVTDFSTGYSALGNLVVDPNGNVVVTDRSAHRVYRLDASGNRTAIAGNGGTTGGGDGQLATSTALQEVRGVWFLPNGAFFVATHFSSRVWYIDTAGYIHLFLHGNRSGAHAGDGTWFYNPTEARVSECRAVTMDYEGNLLITENDIGYVRKVRFLPFEP